jgi:hypothetical protein
VEKRKHQVRAKTPPVDDGHSWRKYGQKDILGAKHPRLAIATSQSKSFLFSSFVFGKPNQPARAISPLESKSYAFAVGDACCGCQDSGVEKVCTLSVSLPNAWHPLVMWIYNAAVFS